MNEIIIFQNLTSMTKMFHPKRAKITGRYFAFGNKYKIQECPILVAA